MKIEATDKELFKKFRDTKFPEIYDENFLDEEIYCYLQGYIQQLLSFRSKGICVYGFSKIELHQQSIDDYNKCVERITNTEKKKEAGDYLEFAKQAAKELNKYITRVEDPVYMLIMKNYKSMIKALRDIPWFHDALVVDCNKQGNDLFLTYELICSKLARENTRIYKMNPKYRVRKDRVAITIKFVNAEIEKGFFDKEYVLGRDNAWVWDLAYETISDIKHRFDIFEIDEGKDFIFTCEYIEFVV